MCYYHFYMYMGCGHSTFSTTPITYCAKATSPKGKDKRDAFLRQIQPDRKNSIAVETVDPRIGSRPQSAKPPPATSLLTTPISPKSKKPTRSSSKRQRSPAPEKNTKLEPCKEGLIHPLHTVRIETLCPGCAADREERLRALAMSSTEINFNPARWQWKYRASGEAPSQKRQHVDGEEEPTVANVDQK